MMRVNRELGTKIRKAEIVRFIGVCPGIPCACSALASLLVTFLILRGSRLHKTATDPAESGGSKTTILPKVINIDLIAHRFAVDYRIYILVRSNALNFTLLLLMTLEII